MMMQKTLVNCFFQLYSFEMDTQLHQIDLFRHKRQIKQIFISGDVTSVACHVLSVNSQASPSVNQTSIFDYAM